MPKVAKITFQLRTIPDLESKRKPPSKKYMISKGVPKRDKKYYANGKLRELDSL